MASTARSIPALVLFASQIPEQSEEDKEKLRTLLLLSPRLQGVVKALESLPLLYEALTKSLPDLRTTLSDSGLQDILSWIKGEKPIDSRVDISSNTWVTTVTVVNHLVLYSGFLDTSGVYQAHAQIIERCKLGGIQGFCSGLLAAVAVACSPSEEDLDKNGVWAVNLAFCIGVLIDSTTEDPTQPGVEFRSIVARGNSALPESVLHQCMERYHDSYVSVIEDAKQFTITASSGTCATLARELVNHGFKVKEIALRGRFHSSCNRPAFQKLREFLRCREDLQLQSTASLTVPVLSNSDAQFMTDGHVVSQVVQCILVDPCNWSLTTKTALAALPPVKNTPILVIGSNVMLTTDIAREIKPWVTTFTLSSVMTRGSEARTSSAHDECPRYGKDHVAVIGMGLRFPKACTIDDFWDLISEGESVLSKIPPSRFETTTISRPSQNDVPFQGAFLDDAASFDHKFFRKSPREAASTDPQQRILLEVAYQALQSAGYFMLENPIRDVGCYLGVGSVDYSDNLICHEPNAFTALGTLRAFLAGKISHFFNLTGPSMTCDTACSSSAVAIDFACKAILSGETSMALAGGVNVITSPYLFENLNGSGFLSPTGQCKPFDSAADGYCRGEGVGIVVLKRLDRALADGDSIRGVIASTAVNQNSNEASLGVPSRRSQAAVMRRAAKLAEVEVSTIDYVEAHGTGTKVGDPIEYSSIRDVLVSDEAKRSSPLYLGSVKGNIGHLEGASGVAALIKVILMMERKTIPPQASHKKLSPRIDACKDIIVPTSCQEWTPASGRRTACINNYGASGNNAAIVVYEAPERNRHFGLKESCSKLLKYPVFVSAQSLSSLQAYCAVLQATSLQQDEEHFPDFVMRVWNEQNPKHRFTAAALVANFSDLAAYLSLVKGQNTLSPSLKVIERRTEEKSKPVVLAFGGQCRDRIRIERSFYDAFALFRSHLDACDAIVKTLGLSSGIIPQCFDPPPGSENWVLYQTLLFSTQYAGAKSWIDAGLTVSCVVGHSLGQITALCVAGVLSLFDALKLVVGRAQLVQKRWGTERGSMLAVEADPWIIESLIPLAKPGKDPKDDQLEVACYNAPSSTVLAGSSDNVSTLQARLQAAQVKTKVLPVSHAYHSVFTEPILDDLENLARQISYREPVIPIETCTSEQSWAAFGPDQIVEHTRLPVYFQHAVHRIRSRYGQCVWLEAGSQSSLMGLVGRCLNSRQEQNSRANDTLLSFAMNKPSAAIDLAHTTQALGELGIATKFWKFHRKERRLYKQINLPPYQFDKHRHWLEWTDPQLLHAANSVATPDEGLKSQGLVTLQRHNDSKKGTAEFIVHTESSDFQLYVKGHSIQDSPLCPASLYLELTAQAIHQLCGRTPCSLSDLEIKSPLVISDTQIVSLITIQCPGSSSQWQFQVQSRPSTDFGSDSPATIHAVGSAEIMTTFSTPQLSRDFLTFESVINLEQFTKLADKPHAQVLQGSIIYDVFSRVTDYREYYQGLRKLVSCEDLVVGHVTLPTEIAQFNGQTLVDPLALDNSLQVAGLQVNCLDGTCGPLEVYVCARLNSVHMLGGLNTTSETQWATSKPRVVCSTGWRQDERRVVRDIFIFDEQTRKLETMIRGAEFVKVSISSLTKKLRVGSSPAASDARHLIDTPQIRAADVRRPPQPIPLETKTTVSGEAENATTALKSILEELLELPMAQITDEKSLEELGIDSIMSLEVVTKINKDMDVKISSTDFAELSTFGEVSRVLTARISRQSSMSETTEASGLNTPDSLATSSQESIADMSTTSELAPQNRLVLDMDSSSEVVSLLGEMLDLKDPVSAEITLESVGLDSLMAMELAVEIQKRFGKVVDSAKMSSQMTVKDLVCLVFPGERFGTSIPRPIIQHDPATASICSSARTTPRPRARPQAPWSPDGTPAKQFAAVRGDYASFCTRSGFNGFYDTVFVAQKAIVIEYIIQAFEQLGPMAWSRLKPGDYFEVDGYLPKHHKLVLQLQSHLQAESLIAPDGAGRFVRTAKGLDREPAQLQLGTLLAAHPAHRDEHQLLGVVGTHLAQVLDGSTNPLQLLFQDPASRVLLEHVYAKAPMYEAMNEMLGTLVANMASANPGKKLRILEIGAGTGGTTRYVLKHLQRLQDAVAFDYLFTDVSSALVNAAKKLFGVGGSVRYSVLDLEKEPSPDLVGGFDLIISTNCVHATADLRRSCSRIRSLLDERGCLLLIELTRNLPWLDVVFGVLDGWWLFDDGRQHALAHEYVWKQTLLASGFDSVDWTDGEGEEEKLLRIVAGFCDPNTNATGDTFNKRSIDTRLSVQAPKVQTIEWKCDIDATRFLADVYTPGCRQVPGRRPIALMIHGGGHVMLSRKDVRPRQVKMLLDYGFLPISIDYRLCPEISIQEGAMVDVADALAWVRSSGSSWSVLDPRFGVIPDPRRVVVVGWSTGGTLALQAGWTAIDRGLEPPSAALAFYCPTDYQDGFWAHPNVPDRSEELCKEPCDILAGVQQKPILGYNLSPAHLQSAGANGWQSSSDPRSRLLFHMNHAGQTLPIVLGALDHKMKQQARIPIFAQPDPQRVAAISPLAHAVGAIGPAYKTPTFIIHGTMDDLIPWEQSQRFYEALVRNGVRADIRLIQGGEHLFDIGTGKMCEEANHAVRDGYMFLLKMV